MVESPAADVTDIQAARRRHREVHGQIYIAEAIGLRRAKIGFSTNAIKRLQNLAVMCPVPLRLLVLIDGPPSLEREIHHQFRSNWAHGEWFDMDYRLERFIDQHALADPMLIAGSKTPQFLPDSVPQQMSYLPDRRRAVSAKPLPRRYRWSPEDPMRTTP